MSHAAASAPSGRRLLMVEDERVLADPVMRGLEEEGYHVDMASDGIEGERKALAGAYDLLIVDWRLPRRDGRSLVQRLRRAGLTMPILMLTALRDVDHRVAGLDAGADDYLTKPFSFEELLARLRALLRRLSETRQEPNTHKVHLQLGPLEVDTARRKVRYGNAVLELRTKEFYFLEVLLRHPDEVVKRTILAERVWGSAYEVTDNAIDVTASNLRQKLRAAVEMHDADASDTVVLETVRGVGYRLTTDP